MDIFRRQGEGCRDGGKTARTEAEPGTHKLSRSSPKDKIAKWSLLGVGAENPAKVNMPLWARIPHDQVPKPDVVDSNMDHVGS